VSLLADWSAFSGLDWPAMLRRVHGGEAELLGLFEQRRPSSDDEVARIYDDTNALIPILLWWHGTDATPMRCGSGAAALMRAAGATRVLDFGCGIGSTSLVLASAGCHVVLADVAQAPLRFARWRLEQRGHAPEVVDLRDESLDRLEPVDGIVALDVVEHLPDPLPAVAALDRVLRADGVIVLNQVWVPAGEEPAHYPRRAEVLTWLHRHGYRLGHVPGTFWIAQKAPLGRRRQLAQGASLRLRVAAASMVAPLPGRAGRAVSARVTARLLR
jgi:2-polyprenyl-3-methyl-5-hydroxy-6-metoxy-1,4-benzoquinol methylase